MLEAALGLLVGSALARWVLWPIEMQLERRRVDRIRRDLDHMKEQHP